MSTFRVNKNKNYTVMSNYHLKDVTLSLKAIGLLSKMLSLPETWDYSVNGLVAICKENKTAVQNTLKELEEHCYLKRTRTKDKSGRFDYIYDVYEVPYIGNATTEEPRTENLVTVNQCTDNVPQLNTKESITKESITKKENIAAKPHRTRFTPPTYEEVKAYCEGRQNGIDAQHFVDYYSARGWELSKGRKVKDWKACVRTWENNSYNRNPTKQEEQPHEQKPKEINVDDFRRADGTIDCDAYMRAQYS